MKKYRIGIVGTGWRAGFFARVAQALPQRFELCGVVCHSEEGFARAKDWNAPLLGTHDALIGLAPDYVVLSVNRGVIGNLLRLYTQHDIPLLIETFAAKDVDELKSLHTDLRDAKIQVAEQYQYQPLNAARIKLAHSGLLGDVYQMQTSLPNGYHAISVQRILLGVGRKRPIIRANRYQHKMIGGPGRGGDPKQETLVDVKQDLFQLDYGDRQAFNDLEDNQHRSFIRTPHWVIRGTRGELRAEDVLYLKDATTPCRFTLERVVAGAGVNLEGLYLRGVRGGQDGWYYQNPFVPARLFDDEIAVAHCMENMAVYLETGVSFYSLTEEIMDLYLTLLVNQAITEGKTIETPPQPWTE